jgi:hypothetical protein
VDEDVLNQWIKDADEYKEAAESRPSKERRAGEGGCAGGRATTASDKKGWRPAVIP